MREQRKIKGTPMIWDGLPSSALGGDEGAKGCMLDRARALLAKARAAEVHDSLPSILESCSFRA